jgi:MFS family permease
LGYLIGMRVVSGFGDALFLTVLFVSAIGAGDGVGQRRFAAITMFVNVGFLVGPLVGEQVRIWFGYDQVWLTSATFLACGSFAVLGPIDHPEATVPATAGARGDWGLIAAIFGPYLAYAVAPAVLTTFGGIAMHEAGAANAAPLFLALSITTILARLAVSVGHVLPESPTWPFAAATAGALLLAMAASNVSGLVLGSAAVGLAQGLATPACARQVSEQIPPGRQRAAMAVSTITLDAGIILAGAALGPLADVSGLTAVFAATAVACAVATVGAAAARHALHRHPRPEGERE